ncbi:MAG: MgtC/SapB family protein [Thermoguttaceae bacterium]
MTLMELATFVLHIGAALVMGVAIGMERQFRQHPAGLRTNALVCVGAALFVSPSPTSTPWFGTTAPWKTSCRGSTSNRA